MEIIAYSTRVSDFHRRNVLYNLPNDLYHSIYSDSIEVKWIGASFTSYIFPGYDSVIKMFSPSRLLMARHLCGDENIRAGVIKHILSTKLEIEVIKRVKNQIKVNSNICALGSERRSGKNVQHFDMNAGIVKYDEKVFRGLKEGPIRALQNAIIRDELEICLNRPSQIPIIINLPTNILDRIDAHRAIHSVSNSIGSLLEIYKRSIEIQNQCETSQALSQNKGEFCLDVDVDFLQEIKGRSTEFALKLIG